MVVSDAKDQPLKGRIALVTGASSGIGKRLAMVLAEAGAVVAIGARRREKLEETAGEVRKQGGRAEPFCVDLTDTAALEALVVSVEESLGPM